MMEDKERERAKNRAMSKMLDKLAEKTTPIDLIPMGDPNYLIYRTSYEDGELKIARVDPTDFFEGHKPKPARPPIAGN